ncbi:MAG: hypothetical protein KC496_12070, partial [Anaerolineae bacterium]|nr:hypothetical protein [Anaerolineae bacterium]
VNGLMSEFVSSFRDAINKMHSTVRAVQPGQTDFSALNRVVGTVVAPETNTRAVHTAYRKAPVFADSQSDAESSAATKENVKATKRNTRAKEQSTKAEEENAASLKKSASVNKRTTPGVDEAPSQHTATDRTSGSAVVDGASE